METADMVKVAVSAAPFSVLACQKSVSSSIQQLISPCGAAGSMPKAGQKHVSSGRVQASVTTVPCARRAA